MKGLGLLTEFSMKAGVKLDPKNIKIDDTTLRDGEQTAGVVFANDEKIHIAKLLDKMGVHQIEAGIPTMGGDEKAAIKAISGLNLNCSVLGWNRAVVSDIDDSESLKSKYENVETINADKLFPEQITNRLIRKALTLIIRYNLDPKTVHSEFLKLSAYRSYWKGVE